MCITVYHKSYELDKPIEVQIWPNQIEILNFPGPIPPVYAEILSSQRRIIARDYRNRRIGDFLKELHLTEGRGTGIPKIYGALERNGSPKPLFETDRDCSYFLTVIYVHSDVSKTITAEEKSGQANDQAIRQNISSIEDLNHVIEAGNDQANDQARNEISNFTYENINDKATIILGNLVAKPLRRAALLNSIGLKNHTDNRKKYLDPLLKIELIGLTIPEKPTHQDQKYKITSKGLKLLTILRS